MLSRTTKASGGDGDEQRKTCFKSAFRSLAHSSSRPVSSVGLNHYPLETPRVRNEVPVPVCLHLGSRPVLRL